MVENVSKLSSTTLWEEQERLNAHSSFAFHLHHLSQITGWDLTGYQLHALLFVRPPTSRKLNVRWSWNIVCIEKLHISPYWRQEMPHARSKPSTSTTFVIFHVVLYILMIRTAWLVVRYSCDWYHRNATAVLWGRRDWCRSFQDNTLKRDIAFVKQMVN